MYRGAEKKVAISWGKMPAISQYVLFVLAISFTWLMGLMGFVRSGLRQHWHVYGVIQDTSVDAFTPTLGYATKVVSVTVFIFFAFIALVFWITGLGQKPDWEDARKSRKQRLPEEETL
jgi:cytochrome bd-type quinol oxidase subunit 1